MRNDDFICITHLRDNTELAFLITIYDYKHKCKHIQITKVTMLSLNQK